MNKRSKINVALLALIALVAALLFLTTGKQEAEQQTSVSAIDKAGITSISITRTGRDALHFSKKGNAWQMVSPRPARANQTRINAILSVLQAHSYTQLDAGKMDLNRFDLVHPAVTLTLNDFEFRFGGSNPLEGRRYLLFQHTIHLIDDGLFEQLQQPAEFFIQSSPE